MRALSWVWLLPFVWPFEYLLRGPFAWWNIPWKTLAGIGIVGAITATCFLILSRWSQKVTLWTSLGILGAWTVIESMLVLTQSGLSQRMLSVGLVALCVFSAMRMVQESKTAYWNPQTDWFEGTPRKVPGVQVVLEGIEGEPLDVASVDLDGAFLVMRRGSESVERSMKSVPRGTQARWTCASNQVEVPVRWVTLDRERRGIGVRFAFTDWESRNQWSEFLNALDLAGRIRK